MKQIKWDNVKNDVIVCVLMLKHCQHANFSFSK